MITGNPPYSGHSKNKGKWITAAIDAYKTVDGKPLSEKNPKWLQDDYVKFIRFAQLKMDSVDEGVVGIITNHSWLDNPTFRGMRQSLMRSFEQIYVLDLHGSSKPKELAPDGAENKNVFDIQKGVAITILIKNSNAPRGIWFAELWGSRLEKYLAVAESKLAKVEWKQIDCLAPYYMCRPLNWRGWDVYQQGWAIADALNPDGHKKRIFAIDVLGFQTHRDHFAIAFERCVMKKRIDDMRDLRVTDQDIRERYKVKEGKKKKDKVQQAETEEEGEDNASAWNLADARASIQMKSAREISDGLVECAYRPFDLRSCF